LKRTDRNDESREIRKEKEFFYVTNWDENAYSFIEIIILHVGAVCAPQRALFMDVALRKKQ